MPGGGGRETGVSAGSVVASRMGALCVAVKQRVVFRSPARPWSSDRSGRADLGPVCPRTAASNTNSL